MNLNESESYSSVTNVPNAETEHVHRFGAWEPIVLPTCETEGRQRRMCLCNEVEERTVSALQHEWSAPTCTEPSVCKKCQTIGAAALDHELDNGYCTRCLTSFRTAEDVQKILKIVNASVYQIDSAGGVSVDIGWENPSEKTINYIKFTVSALNAVGDPVKCSIRREYDFTLTQTGPFAPGERVYTVDDGGHYGKGTYIWDNVWYNDTAKTILISRVIIQYADGSEIDLSQDDVKLAYSPMSLSTTAVELNIEMPQFTISSSNPYEQLEIEIISDEGYLIQKNGKLQIKLTEVTVDLNGAPGSFIEGAVFYNQTHTIDEGNYTDPYRNILLISIDPGITEKGMTGFKMELIFTPDGEEGCLTYSTYGYLRVI